MLQPFCFFLEIGCNNSQNGQPFLFFPTEVGPGWIFNTVTSKNSIIKGPTFEDYFFRKKVRGEYVGTIYGWPFTVYKACARIMKWEPMQKYCKGRDCSFLLGIAKGENRKVLAPNKSLLLKYGLTEDDARNTETLFLS